MTLMLLVHATKAPCMAGNEQYLIKTSEQAAWDGPMDHWLHGRNMPADTMQHLIRLPNFFFSE